MTRGTTSCKITFKANKLKNVDTIYCSSNQPTQYFSSPTRTQHAICLNQLSSKTDDKQKYPIKFSRDESQNRKKSETRTESESLSPLPTNQSILNTFDIHIIPLPTEKMPNS